MIAIPAVDLRDGACVQLVGGSYDEERIRLDNPPDVAKKWEYAGFKRLHVVDLDAATGRGDNSAVVRDVLRATSLTTQVGGGVRDERRVETLLSDGAEFVIVGTRAIEDQEWLNETSNAYPGRIIVAADVRDRRVVVRGWGEGSGRHIDDLVTELNAFPLAGLLVTAVHKEGQMQGTDLPLMEDVAEASDFPLYASGGIGTIGDLRALEDRGVAAVVIGMALYTGAIDPRAVAEEFSE
jgi:phosphoribosylformimino-5-aminoimidazole carboxamide ribotide isomerase